MSLQARLGLKVKPTVCEKIHKRLVISFFLYLDLYVFGDDALVGWGSFLRQTGHRCVLVRIWTKAEVGAVKPV